MNLIFNAFLGFLFLFPWFCLLMLVRNRWVYRQLTRLNSEHSDELRRLIARRVFDHPLLTHMEENWIDHRYLTYEQMMWRFWVWDVEKLRK